MNDSGIIASYLLSPLSKITNPQKTRHFKLVKDPNSNRVKVLFLRTTIPVTLYNRLLTFRDTGKKFELERHLLKMITNKNYIVDFSKSLKKNKVCFSKKCILIKKATGIKRTRDRSLIRLLK